MKSSFIISEILKNILTLAASLQVRKVPNLSQQLDAAP